MISDNDIDRELKINKALGCKLSIIMLCVSLIMKQLEVLVKVVNEIKENE